ncbi:uncharacterized protein LOC141586550 isoform X1 [Silene latifolia]|uniref:uncharacterized protein LOC141586550 isoform X1 n=1 Tax=Silene latifolia TaxID=37657 RepID=UPI003D774338
MEKLFGTDLPTLNCNIYLSKEKLCMLASLKQSSSSFCSISGFRVFKLLLNFSHCKWRGYDLKGSFSCVEPAVCKLCYWKGCQGQKLWWEKKRFLPPTIMPPKSHSYFSNNLILAGVESVTFYDEGVVESSDMPSTSYFQRKM